MKWFRSRIIKIPRKYKICDDYVLSEEEINNTNTALYINGVLKGLKPRNKSISLYEDRNIAYNARYLYIEDRKYDLYSAEDVCKIAVGKFSKPEGMFLNVTADLSYLLHMRACKDTYKNLSIALVFKAVELMIESPIGWTKKDYLRVIGQLTIVGEEDLRENLYNQIKAYVPDLVDEDYYIKKHTFEQLERAKQNNYDYMIIPFLGCACGECVKYEGRIYCISGKDKNFPKFPKHIKENGYIHKGCHHSIYACMNPYNEKFERFRREESGDRIILISAKESSNRPFIDDRSDYEKKLYEEYIKKLMWDRKSDNNFIKRKLEYNWIKDKLPDYAPKSLNAYTAMKRAKSKRYLVIKEKAKELGVDLDDDL